MGLSMLERRASMNIMPLPEPPTILALPETVRELLKRLDGIPPSRILLQPPPGTATEQDVIEAEARGRICELVDGVLVEKAMGYYEDRLAMVLGHYIETFLDTNDLGIVLGGTGMMRPRPGLVRMPDVAFYAWSQFSDRLLPDEQILSRTPDLAVEVLSPKNTKREMDRKRGEYFGGGAQLVWQVYPKKRRVRVYTAVDQFEEYGEDQTLTGGAVLPGFTLSVRRWFERAGQREE
jgi:Uma2 family endonuclease